MTGSRVHVPRLIASLAAVLVLVAPAATARAVPATQSSISSPIAGTHFLDTGTGVPVVITGTTNGGAGDLITAVCFRDPSSGGPTFGSVNSAAGGVFQINNASVPAGTSGACVLRAAIGFVSGNQPQFAGPFIAIDRQTDVTNAATTRIDINDFVQQDQGGTGVRSIGQAPGGLVSPRLTDTPGQRNSADVLHFGGAILRGDLTVDGHPAYPPASADDIPGDAGGIIALGVARARDGAAGDATVSEQDTLVLCAGDPPAPTATNCPVFSPAGVGWNRTTRTSAGGTRLEQLDTITSLDGATHTVAAWVDYSALSAVVNPAFGVSWVEDGARRARSAGEQLAGPPAGSPGTLLVDASGAAPDGDATYGHAAITWDAGPTLVRFGGSEDAAARFEDLVVSAGRDVILRTRYVLSPSAAPVAEAARVDRDSLAAPTLTITGPADGATAFTPFVTITGSARDSERLASLTVAGQAVTPAADGTFSVPLTLPLGSTRVEALATDGVGQVSSAAITLSYADTIAPALSALRISPATFRVTASPTAISATTRRRKKTPAGTVITYTLGEAAPVTLAIARLSSGRRSKGRCVRATRKLRKAKRCDRAIAAGRLTRAGTIGPNIVKFSGRIASKALKPGRYRVSVSARDAAGNASRTQSATFSVVAK